MFYRADFNFKSCIAANFEIHHNNQAATIGFHRSEEKDELRGCCKASVGYEGFHVNCAGFGEM